MAVRTTLFPIIFLDPWRIEPEVCHDLHPNAKLNICANNATKIVLKSISFHSPKSQLKADPPKWIIGSIAFRTVVILGALVSLGRIFVK
jgi:hypothetical protein